ncbi:DUF4058 family protein [Frigoriglobus tundricola]|uniref:DUF4058 domain-containing protein n=1 Tax=Frigoriglobus tundricola TaxID=2774151 RepID=A0A6M5YKI1_9BACT|nr:DUF4058 family protein [Frigoriglobus tundricola]QJW94084.1 hypothetical protein FTUN_1603 [Frigoriglobus tundricola]
MPIHDWTRVSAGTWHDFHLTWIAELRNALNDGRMPPDYYAQAEQIVGPLGPDVLALQESAPHPPQLNGALGLHPVGSDAGGIAVAMAPPHVRYTAEADMDDYVLKRRTIVIRHNSGDRIVALVEIVSPGNKSGQNAFDSFVEKAQEALYRGYHLLVIDLFPPGPRDPGGIHAAIWSALSEDVFRLTPDEPLALLAYSAGARKKAYIEPTAVGRALIDMPLFLTPDVYVNAPLEETYRAAYRGVPRKWKAVLEAPSA